MTSLANRLGFQLLSLDDDQAVGKLPYRGNTQPYGVLHGAANAFLVEHLASLFAQHLFPEKQVAGLDLHVTHIKPAMSDVTAHAHLVAHQGRTVIVAVDMYCAGELSATGQLLCRLLTCPPPVQ